MYLVMKARPGDEENAAKATGDEVLHTDLCKTAGDKLIKCKRRLIGQTNVSPAVEVSAYSVVYLKQVTRTLVVTA